MVKFDLQKTAELDRLFAVPREHRDDTWTGEFYAAVPDASLAADSPQVRRGPDELPYFSLRMPTPGVEFDAFCLTHVLDACTTNGFGCTVSGPGGANPEWVFTYGNLWSLREFGGFDLRTRMAAEQPGGGSNQVLVAAPSESFLPEYVRVVLRRYLAEAGVAPEVMLVEQPGATPPRSLVFPAYADQFGGETDYRAFMNRLTWYLPPHYGLIAARRDATWARFGPL